MVCLGTKISLEIIFDDPLLRKQALLHYKKADCTKWPYWPFFKGGTTWLWSKIGNYCLVCFGTKINLEIIFDDPLLRKQAFLHYKKADFTKWLYWLFFKGGTLWWWSKVGNYASVCFGTKISLEIIFDDRLLRKQALLHYKKADFTKWPYWLFFKGGTPWWWSKIGNYSLVCFGTKTSLEIIFDDRLVRQQAFLHYKKAHFTKWRYWLFFKEGTPRLWSKIGNYSLVCFGTKIGLEIIFDDRLVRKQALQNYKKAHFTKWRYWLFFKEGTPRLWSKIGNYSLVCFGTKTSLEIIFDDRVVRKQALLHYKKADLKKWTY